MQVTQTRTQNRTRTQDQTTAQTPTRTTAVNRIQLMRPAKAKLPASHLKITLLTILTITYWISLEQIKAKNIVHAPPQKRNTRTRTRTQMISWLTPRIPEWREAHEDKMASQKLEVEVDERGERLNRYRRARTEAMERYGRYVEDLEEIPLDSEEQGAQESLTSKKTGAQGEEAGARIEEQPPPSEETGASEEEQHMFDGTLDDISATSSEIYEAQGGEPDFLNVTISKVEEYVDNKRMCLMSPSLFSKYTLRGFLSAAAIRDLKHWWSFVPNRIMEAAKSRHYVNAMIGGREFHEVLMNQMTAKAGIKKHGNVAIAALIKELTHNLVDKDVIEGKKFGELSQQQRKDALRVVALIKEKRNGVVKGHVCADGRPQRAYTDRDEVYSPTVSTEGMTLSLAIDAYEKRFVAVTDIDGAYLHAHMDEFVLMMFEGEMAEMLVKASPQYKQFLHVTRNGKKLLYVRLKRALYGCIRSAMLWWKMLSEFLIADGFKLNPYDSCVANKTLPCGKQITICWYVDDSCHPLVPVQALCTILGRG